MKILISGICGFAGSVIARGLVAARPDMNVFGFDNLSRRGSETNIDPLRSLGVGVEIGDVRDVRFLSALPRADWIIDCAANPSVLAGVGGGSSSRELVDINLSGTVNLLELCREWSAGFLLLSTSRVYSIRSLAGLPFQAESTRFELPAEASGRGWSTAGVAEDFPTDPPISLYGSTKLASEALALEYGEAFGFPVWINRCGVLAGAGQFGRADQGIFSFWIHSWVEGRPLRYLGFDGKGRQVRDCLHPDDLVPHILRQIEGRSGAAPRICNLGGGPQRALSLCELSAWCHEFLGPSQSEDTLITTTTESRPYDVPWMVMDCAQAAANWTWSPQRSLTDILSEISNHARANPRWLDRVA